MYKAVMPIQIFVWRCMSAGQHIQCWCPQSVKRVTQVSRVPLVYHRDLQGAYCNPLKKSIEIYFRSVSTGNPSASRSLRISYHWQSHAGHTNQTKHGPLSHAMYTNAAICNLQLGHWLVLWNVCGSKWQSASKKTSGQLAQPTNLYLNSTVLFHHSIPTILFQKQNPWQSREFQSISKIHPRSMLWICLKNINMLLNVVMFQTCSIHQNHQKIDTAVKLPSKVPPQGQPLPIQPPQGSPPPVPGRLWDGPQ